ncbi:hypothetical protein PBY51_017289 [Eleginops maclovinus]|uniref:Uncharacterized protein n=1 Tax=Eleginops maclovinus TaxID=56733 RepID=A0AAN7XGT4_ELEMC|nr:hypothetical protein PBY51_017289 [Eleginops maclovinus]
MGDAGSYTCTVSAFPGGSLEGTTKLIVKEQQIANPLSAGMVFAIVIAVILLLAIVPAIIYFVFIRKRDPEVRHRVYIDTDGPVMDVSRQSVLKRDVDVVYSVVKLKTDALPPAEEKHSAADVTYSEVAVMRHQFK